MEVLLTYLKSLDRSAQDAFARRCKTSVGYLRKAASAKQRIAESTAIAIERESGGVVRVELTRPDVDWAYLRGTGAPSSLTKRKRA
jgi:DNA-binding transcriptional regulator YdaS (Cro superfamily)